MDKDEVPVMNVKKELKKSPLQNMKRASQKLK